MSLKLSTNIKNTALRLRPVIYLCLKLLLLLSLIKCIFYFYNIQSGQGWQISGIINMLQIIFWSLLYDLFILSILLVVPVLGLSIFKNQKVISRIIQILTSFMLASVCTLNLADAFYYPFKLQRSDAELFYVLRNPFRGVDAGYWIYFLLTIAALLCFSLIIHKFFKPFITQARRLHAFWISSLFFGGIALLFCISGTKKLLPTYLLTKLTYNQLPLAQNSMHTFIYSSYRLKSAGIFDGRYLMDGTDGNLLQIHTQNQPAPRLEKQKNIVLFIMESVPYDFFDPNSPYNVDMPFIDSLVNLSTFYSNCFSYSHNSNKAITAILTGTPTLTEIPLYHSSYTAIPLARSGSLLKNQGYQSSFFIGDNYDDFGFAKCVNWLGIENYYCKQDVPGYQDMEQHSMGLHDEFVFNFMEGKINNMKPPFFATNFNISTHIPNDLPETYLLKNPQPTKTAQMKSMQYYSDCLSAFFAKAKTRDWYSNSVFIFVSDHWMYPNFEDQKNDVVQNFRIPLFIFDPQNIQAKTVHEPVSQLDIVNTVLAYSNYTDSFISYGKNLLNPAPDSNRVVFAKENNIIYQAFDNRYVLGFDAVQGKPAFCFDYIHDTGRKNNLVADSTNQHVKRLSLEMKAFLRTAYQQYRKKIIP